MFCLIPAHQKLQTFQTLIEEMRHTIWYNVEESGLVYGRLHNELGHSWSELAPHYLRQILNIPVGHLDLMSFHSFLQYISESSDYK
jgi:hypothetical protein